MSVIFEPTNLSILLPILPLNMYQSKNYNNKTKHRTFNYMNALQTNSTGIFCSLIASSCIVHPCGCGPSLSKNQELLDVSLVRPSDIPILSYIFRISFLLSLNPLDPNLLFLCEKRRSLFFVHHSRLILLTVWIDFVPSLLFFLVCPKIKSPLPSLFFSGLVS